MFFWLELRLRFFQEVFWAVIKHGSIVTDADVLPKEAGEEASARKTAKNRKCLPSSLVAACSSS